MPTGFVLAATTPAAFTPPQFSDSKERALALSPTGIENSPTNNSTKTGAGFTFTYKDQKFELSQSELDSWRGQQTITSTILNPAPQDFQSSMLTFLGRPTVTPTPQTYHYQLNYIYNYVQNISTKIDQPEQDPVLTFENQVVKDFVVGKTGLATDIYKTSFDALNSLENGQAGVEVTVNEISPKNSLADTNNLGINELIAEGVSTFGGSPNNRRHNINVGVEKFKGAIIKQGEEFSFNKILGPVDGEHGFLPELVIKKEGTIPEFGGGLCQVSSTTFRAAMQAGLPIKERRNHAYAVQYYAPQGTDATIYPGSVDLKFVNDTPGAILIWPYLKDRNTLIFDFYGTKDSRQVTLEKPEQHDRLPDGSMKASWTRLVTKDGITKTDVFKSTYQSPALFHKTEQFVTGATTTPASTLVPKTN